MLKNIFSAVVVFLLATSLKAQQPFINEINHFRKTDSLQTPPVNPILFVGSSSFTLWKDVKDNFPGCNILNRGFGGSSLPHLIMYAEDVIFKYNPKQIVIYCGENDLTPGIKPSVITDRFKELYKLIRSRFPETPLVYISMKPSPSREQFLPVMKKANKQIEKYLKRKKHSEFIDVFHSMLNADGSIKQDIFKEDRLHMNSKGYEIWQPLIAPHLLCN